MDAAALAAFREIWAVDFEFIARPGERPIPVCLVAHELRSGRKIKHWQDQLGPTPPYAVDAGALFIAYYASAELGCHKVLGWPMPARVLDLFSEFRGHTNGLPTPSGAGLIGALAYYGVDSIGTTEKKEMRNLVLRGGPWSEDEREAILEYCSSDVTALVRLMPAMLPHLDLPRSLVRGRYMSAVAAMEHAGVPINARNLESLRQNWEAIQDQLIADIDTDFNVYDGRTFKQDRFEAFLIRAGIPWGRTESGQLELSDDAFRQAAKAHPIIAPLRELRSSLSDMRLSDLAVGEDGRNRALLSPFRSRTGRNQPSNSKFIFGPSVWLRGLIEPPPGHGLAYIDWAQQEFGIAAALSGDRAMQEAYLSGDPYLAFAKQARAIPEGATKDTHGPQRELFKVCILAVQYGMEAYSLALRIGCSPIIARELLRAHRETYKTFWRWSDAALDCAMLTGSLQTVLGWHVHVATNSNPRSLRNFPMQANGAEMLRLACCLATEAGIEVCAPVHDAILICSPLDRLDEDIAKTRAFMAEASKAVLAGFELRSEAEQGGKFPAIIRHPQHYMDKRGAVMWKRVWRLIEAANKKVMCA